MAAGAETAEADGLIARIGRGDETALGRLVVLTGPALRGFAARFLGSEAEGEEVVQEVFLAVWSKAAGYDPAKGAAMTWLWRIARNACIDRQRRRRLRWLVGWDAEPPEVPDPTPGQERIHGARAALETVRREIAALPDRQRMALLLAAVGGMDTPEIAGIIGSSRGAVEQLLVRARRQLRARLPEIAEEWDDG